MNSDLIQRLERLAPLDPLAKEALDALTAAQEENERLVHDIERLSASLSAEVSESERLKTALETIVKAAPKWGDSVMKSAVTMEVVARGTLSGRTQIGG